jgi:hypothetical protein
MKSSKNTRKMSTGSGSGTQQFLIWHGEKIAVGVFAVAALVFALQGLTNKTVKWAPEELVRTSEDTERAIQASRYTPEDAKIEFFNYGDHAGKSKEAISVVPYRTGNWNPTVVQRSSNSTQ